MEVIYGTWTSKLEVIFVVLHDESLARSYSPMSTRVQSVRHQVVSDLGGNPQVASRRKPQVSSEARLCPADMRSESTLFTGLIRLS